MSARPCFGFGAMALEPVKIGVIGLGRFGRLHALTLAGLAEAELVGLVGPPAGEPGSLLCRASRRPGMDEPRGGDSRIGRRSMGCRLHDRRARACHENAAASRQDGAARKAGRRQSGRGADPGVAGASRFEQSDARPHRPLQQRIPATARRGQGTRPDRLHRLRPASAGKHRSAVSRARTRCTPRWSTISTRCRCSSIGPSRSISVRSTIGPATARSIWRWRSSNGRTDRWRRSPPRTSLPSGMPPRGFDRTEVFGEGWAARISPNPRPIEVWGTQAEWPMPLEIRAGSGRRHRNAGGRTALFLSRRPRGASRSRRGDVCRCPAGPGMDGTARYRRELTSDRFVNPYRSRRVAGAAPPQ